MRLLSWNVQWCRGMDGRVDPRRIAAEIMRLADPDVACLQEIAVNDPELMGSSGEDQVSILSSELGACEAFFVPAVDLPGKRGRRQFGNLVLSRLPAGRVMRHQLPWPPAPQPQTMPRALLEVVVEAPFGGLRVMTTHLEYYSGEHRGVQVARIAELHRERAASALLCGDFNFKPEDPLHRRMLEAGFADAWQALNAGKPRPATFHLYDGETPYCCDYVFLTPDLVPRLKSLRIDSQTQASDHQPLIVELQ